MVEGEVDEQGALAKAVIRELHGLGVRLTDSDGNDLTGDSAERVVRRVLAAAALDKHLKAAVAHRLRAGRERLRAEGQGVEGRKPFGDRPGEDKTIERMKKLRARGLSFEKIADKLNEENVPTRTGKKWHGKVVRDVLGRALKSGRPREDKS